MHRSKLESLFGRLSGLIKAKVKETRKFWVIELKSRLLIGEGKCHSQCELHIPVILTETCLIYDIQTGNDNSAASFAE
jgi:hypothetical protein